MIVIPRPVKNGTRADIYIILEDENIERIKAYDPAEVVQQNLPARYHGRINNIIVGYVTPAEKEKVFELCRTGDFLSALRLISRGFKYRPDLGDSDEPYKSGV